MRIRFNLKTAFWTIAAASLILGLWVVKAREFRSIDRISSLGGYVLFESDGYSTMPDSPAVPFNSNTPYPSMVTTFCENYLGIVVGDSARYAYVYGYYEPMTDSVVESLNLQAISSLRGVSFADTQVADQTVGYLRSLSGIREISLKNTRITRQSLPLLVEMRDSLWMLDVRETALDHDDIAYLKEAMQGVEILHD